MTNRHSGSAITNKREIVVHALQRSGHHAFIYWICDHLEGRYAYINDAHPKRHIFDPDRIARTPDLNLKTNIEGFSAEAELVEPSPKDLLVYNVESRDPAKAWRVLARNREPWLGASERLDNIVLVRDPLNNFASLYQRLRGNPPARILDKARKYSKTWTQHAKACLGEALALPSVSGVDFYLWLTSEPYRAWLSTTLDIPNGPLPQQAAHKGSSFNDAPHENPARLLNRWKRFSDDSLFGLFFVDPGLVQAARAYYRRVHGRPDLADAVTMLAERGRRQFGLQRRLPRFAWQVLGLGRKSGLRQSGRSQAGRHVRGKAGAGPFRPRQACRATKFGRHGG